MSGLGLSLESRPEVRRLIFYDSESELNPAFFEHTFVKFGQTISRYQKFTFYVGGKIFEFFLYEYVGHPDQTMWPQNLSVTAELYLLIKKDLKLVLNFYNLQTSCVT